jgi:hypothetical protein
MTFAVLSDLPLGRAHCAVCVRVVHLWDYCGNKEGQLPLHVDMVLVDEKVHIEFMESGLKFHFRISFFLFHVLSPLRYILGV